MSKNLLDDDFEWDNVNEDVNDSAERQSVVMLRTFNTEEQAHLAAATLHSAGIDAHVVSASTGQLTPFAYGNVRLFVAKSQMEMAENVLKEGSAMQEVYNDPQLSAGKILIVLVAGIFAMGLILRLIQLIFGFLVF
jgi:hypothetical protein